MKPRSNAIDLERVRELLLQGCKALLDSLTHAGVWEDDSLVDDLRLIRGEVRKPGGCVVEIRLIQEAE